MNKAIQKKYHAPTGHRQSIEYHVLAQNKRKLYFNSDYFEIKYSNQLKTQQVFDEKDTFNSRQTLAEMKSFNLKDKEKQMKIDSKIWNFVHIDETAKRIRFNSTGILDFKYLLDNIKHKFNHFGEIIIENEDIEILKDNDFGEISFDKVYIKGCPRLRRIHYNAFGKQSDKIKEFWAWRNENNLLPISESNSDYDLMKLINSLVNCTEIKMYSFKLQPIKLNILKKLSLTGNYAPIKITSICDYAFYECDQIEEINLSYNNISYISEYGFDFRNSYDNTLVIYLFDNKLDESSFAIDSLCNFKRAVKFRLLGNNIIYLDEEVFKTFLDANQLNTIEIDKRYFDMKNKENQWNQLNVKYQKRISFRELIIENYDLKSIEENQFEEMNCDEIVIKNCSRLKQIHWNAFGKQTDKISQFNLWPKLPNLISKPDSNYDLMKLINSLVNCQIVSLIPFHHEIQPLKLKKLTKFILKGLKSSIKITSICDYAFYECDSIQWIDLSENNINNISENAFHFKTKCDQSKLEICLTNNNLDELSFAINSLTKFNKPTELYLWGNNIIYLDEEVFKPFLDVNKSNSIEIDKRYFHFNNQNNQWTEDIHFEGIHIK